MIKKFIFTICLFASFTFQLSAQKATALKTNLNIEINDGKSTVKPGEQVVLTATGLNEETSYLQWQSSKDGVNWQDITKANGNNFETLPITETQYVRVVSRPNEGYLAVEEASKSQVITLTDNVASSKKKRQ